MSGVLQSCCFLRPTANCRKENDSGDLQLNFTSYCKHLVPCFQPVALLLLLAGLCFKSPTPPPDQQLVNLSVAYSPYRECCDIRLISK